MNAIDTATIRSGEFPLTVRVRNHAFTSDVTAATGSHDAAPGPHDLFDAALATCKAMTALWYARRKGIPLERVETHVERDDSEERKGVYKLKVRVAFHGALTDEQKKKLYDVIERCPVHKLMTKTEVIVETAPL